MIPSGCGAVPVPLIAALSTATAIAFAMSFTGAETDAAGENTRTGVSLGSSFVL
jgi:hypothetical protein